MDLVTAWPAGKHEKSRAIKHGSVDYDDPDIMDCASVESAPQSHARINRPPPLPMLGSSTVQEPTLRGVQFDMHLSNETSNTKTHIYTSIQSEIGSAARNLEQVPSWQTMFPQLASRYNEGRVDCPLFLFESRLRLINDIRVGLSLGIEFAVDFAEGGYFHDWRSLTRIHRQESSRQYFEDSEFEETWDRLECLESRNGQRDIQLTIPFKSKWWVKLFSSIISERDVARNAKDREAMKHADECAAAHLRELSIMQELWATQKGGSSRRPQRMATLLWTFSQSRNGEAATTTWRPLTLSTSASPYQVQEPILRGMQPSMSLDSTLQESMAQVQPDIVQQQSASFYDFRGHHEPNRQSLFSESSEALLTSHLSECETESTTPILDYNSSFPSSTSASFPSSISNASGYPGHHGSSFDSQDGRSSYTHSLESSFHSQHPSHDHAGTTIFDIQAQTMSSFKNPHGAYPDSQDLLFPSHPSSIYDNLSEYPSFSHRNSIDDPTIVIQPTHQTDFTGGALHLAYAGAQGSITTDQLSPADEEGFQAPLIAPRASLLPQQQVSECLHNFESWVPPPPGKTASPPAVMLAAQSQQRGPDDMETEDLQQEDGCDVGVEGNDDERDDGSERLCGNAQIQMINYHDIHDRHQRNQYQQHQPPLLRQQRQHQQFPMAAPQKVSQSRRVHHSQEISQIQQTHPEDADDSENHRHDQIQYLQDAHDHWEHSFNPALWPVPGLQMSGTHGNGPETEIEMGDQEEEDAPGMRNNLASELAQGHAQGRVLGEIQERIQGIEALVGAREWNVSGKEEM